jgi:hypothetical protein
MDGNNGLVVSLMVQRFCIGRGGAYHRLGFVQANWRFLLPKEGRPAIQSLPGQDGRRRGAFSGPEPFATDDAAECDTMFGQKKNRGLYYLLPGMNRSNRIRQRQILKWSILVGVVAAALVGLLIWFINYPPISYH